MEEVHKALANAAASAGIEKGSYDIAGLWGEGNTEVIVNAIQQGIDEFKER